MNGIRHPFREILHRSSDPAWVADTAVRAVTTGWDQFSPSTFAGLYRKVRRHTMCSKTRLRALFRGVRYVVRHNVVGDLVECGCARGGSAALMGLALRQFGAHRRLWLFDTFEGLPAPTSDDPDFEIADLFTGTCFGDIAEVRELFERLEIAEGLHLVRGLFQDTLPLAEVPQIALLHIDGDWYESVRACLENLYDRVTPGGLIQFDDYGYWQGARRAVDEFFERHAIRADFRRIDYSGRSFVKPCCDQ